MGCSGKHHTAKGSLHVGRPELLPYELWVERATTAEVGHNSTLMTSTVPSSGLPSLSWYSG